MGVMLSLDRPGLARNRRQARHARRTDEQAWADSFTAILRDDSPHAGCLVRLAKNALAGLQTGPDRGELEGPANRAPGPEHQPAQAADFAPGQRPAPLGPSRPGPSLPGLSLSGPSGPGPSQPGLSLSGPPRPGPSEPGPPLSGACLLGQCEDSPGAPACASATCQHDCHGRAPATGSSAVRPVSSVA
jgi:hypothetical protein